MKRKKTPMHVGDILEKATARTTLGKQLEQARIWQEWTQIVGPTMASHCQPDRFKRKVLHVVVDDSVWMNRVSYAKQDILNNINALQLNIEVTDLYIRLVKEKPPAKSQDVE